MSRPHVAAVPNARQLLVAAMVGRVGLEELADAVGCPRTRNQPEP